MTAEGPPAIADVLALKVNRFVGTRCRSLSEHGLKIDQNLAGLVVESLMQPGKTPVL